MADTGMHMHKCVLYMFTLKNPTQFSAACSQGNMQGIEDFVFYIDLHLGIKSHWTQWIYYCIHMRSILVLRLSLAWTNQRFINNRISVSFCNIFAFKICARWRMVLKLAVLNHQLVIEKEAFQLHTEFHWNGPNMTTNIPVPHSLAYLSSLLPWNVLLFPFTEMVIL